MGQLADELPRKAAGVQGEVPRSRWFLAQGLQFWTAHPIQAIGLYLRKLWLYFHAAEIPRDTDLYEFRSGSRVLRALVGPRRFWFPDGLLRPLALVGIASSVRERVRLAWPLLFVALQAAVVAMFFVSARYRVPALPMLVLFAVVGAIAIFRAPPKHPRAAPDLHRGLAFRKLGKTERSTDVRARR